MRRERYDVCVIGGGILGCMMARALGRYEGSFVLLEAEEELCSAITKTNSAILYAGYDQKPGTLKAALTVEGNSETERVCRELGVPLNRCGLLMIGTGPKALNVFQKKQRLGEANGVPDIALLDRKGLEELEPELPKEFIYGLHSKGTGTFYPWELGLAAAHAAKEAGVEFRMKCPVTEIVREDNGYGLTAGGEVLHTRAIINCAGMAADKIRELLFPPKVRIFATAADFLIFPELLHGPKHILSYEAEDRKGINLIPGHNGSILAGPSGREPVPGHDTKETDREGMEFVKRQAGIVWPALAGETPLRAFAGLRPNPFYVEQGPDGEYVKSDRSIPGFVIDIPETDPAMVSLIGIKTPGLTCCTSLSRYVTEKILEALEDRGAGLKLKAQKEAFGRHAVLHIRDLSFEEKVQAAEKDPSYGRMLCECEQITEGEVLEAIRLGAVSVEGVKRRCGTGFGRCQGSRCRKKIERLLKKPEPRVFQGRTEDAFCDYLIIGGGAAGMRLAIHLSETGPEKNIIIAEKEPVTGGALIQCTHVGFRSPRSGELLSGVAYKEELEHMLAATKTKVYTDTCVTEIHKEVFGDGFCCTAAADGAWIHIHASQVISAVGALERPAGMLETEGGRFSDVYTAGELQYKCNITHEPIPGRIVIIGAGNMGLILADQLRSAGSEVVLVAEQLGHIPANSRNRENFEKGTEIPLLLNHRLVRILGRERLEAVVLRNEENGEEQTVPCDKLAVAAGLIPDRQLLFCSEKKEPSVSERLQSFGNCEHIYTVIDNIEADVKKWKPRVTDDILQTIKSKSTDFFGGENG